MASGAGLAPRIGGRRQERVALSTPAGQGEVTEVRLQHEDRAGERDKKAEAERQYLSSLSHKSSSAWVRRDFVTVASLRGNRFIAEASTLSPPSARRKASR